MSNDKIKELYLLSMIKLSFAPVNQVEKWRMIHNYYKNKFMLIKNNEITGECKL